NYVILPLSTIERDNKLVRRVSGRFSTRGHVYVLKSSGKVSIDFLYYLLRVTDMRPALQGSVTQQISKQSLGSIWVGLPDGEETNIAESLNDRISADSLQHESLLLRLKILEQRPVGHIHRVFEQNKRA